MSEEENETSGYSKWLLFANLANVLVTIAGLTLCSAAQVYLAPSTSITAGVTATLSGFALWGCAYSKSDPRWPRLMSVVVTIIAIANAAALFRPFLATVLA